MGNVDDKDNKGNTGLIWTGYPDTKDAMDTGHWILRGANWTWTS